MLASACRAMRWQEGPGGNGAAAASVPDVGRNKSCVQDKMGQLSKGCLDKLLDAMSGSSFKVCKDQTYALCAPARCSVLDSVAHRQCDMKHGDSISLPFSDGQGRGRLLDQR
jgi:hypothetical protein